MKFVYRLINAGYYDDNGQVIHVLSAEQFDHFLQVIVFEKKNMGINESAERVILETDDKGSGIQFSFESGQPTLTLYKAK